MNLEESDSFVERERKNNNKKRAILSSIILLAVIAALLFILILIISYQDSLKLKLYIDGKQKSITTTLLEEVDGVTYANIKEFANLVGYTYTKGEYMKYNENQDSCYLSNNFEVVALTAEAETYSKYIVVSETDLASSSSKNPIIGTIETTVKSEEGVSESYKLENPVILINDSIYMAFENLTDAFNVQINTNEENRIKVYTLDALVSNALSSISKLGTYSDMSSTYENLRALIYNMAVVGDGNYYGVVSLKTGESIMSTKYNEIVFVQNAQEFLVTADTTVGLLSKDGTTIIKPTEYDEISVLDELNGLYLVKKGKKYGVLNRKGNVVVYVEYDVIGYKNSKNFTTQNIESSNIWFDSAIPVEQDSKYGLFSIDGTELLKTVYSGFGYEAKEKSTSDKSNTSNEESVLLIPETIGIKGIVVNLNEGYGIYDVTEQSIIIPTVCTKIYSITKSGTTKYYMEYNGEQIELESYLETNGLKNINEKDTVPTSSEDTEDLNNTSSNADN